MTPSFPRALLTPLVIATVAVGMTWLMVFFDSLEERSTGEGYAPVPDRIAPIALGCAMVLVVVGIGTVALLQVRARLAAPAALLTGVATTATAPMWSVLDNDGIGFLWLPLGVGVLEIFAAGWLVLRRVPADPSVRPLGSLALAGLMLVAGLVCAGIGGSLLVSLALMAGDLDAVGRFEEDESPLMFAPILIALTVVFTTCGVALLRSLVRRWPRPGRRVR